MTTTAEVIPLNRTARQQQLWDAYQRELNAFWAQPTPASLCKAGDAYKAFHREFVGSEFTY
jgi:hypothetical protein